MGTFKTLFPPLALEIPRHLEHLEAAVARVLAGEASTPLPAATYWTWYDTADAGRVARLPTAELREAWRKLGRVHARFTRACDEAVAAASKDGKEARAALTRAFAASKQLAGLLAGGAIAELLSELEQQARLVAARYENDLLEVAHMGRFSVRLSDLSIVDADARFLEFCGRQEGVVGTAAASVLGKANLDRVLEAARASAKAARVPVRLASPGGETVFLELTPWIEREDSGEVLRVFALNVSRREAEANERKLLSIALDSSAQEVLITDAQFRILYANAAFTRMSGYALEEVRGKNPRFLEGAYTREAARMTLRQALAQGEPVRVEILDHHKDGRPYWVDLSIVPVRDEQGEISHYVATQMDITERKLTEANVARMALTDYLTGLPNRRAAEDRLALEWSRARRGHGSFALAVVDIDRFKLVNDQYGHHVGDTVLRHVADVMVSSLRGGDWLARWGGEEFLVCFHDLDARGARVAAERLRKEVKSQVLRLAQGALPTTVSMGVVCYDEGFADVDAMLAQADALLYEAKTGGRDRVVCAAGDGRRKGVIWEGGLLQAALTEGRVLPAFQSIVDLRTGRVVAEEALARFLSRDGELVPAQSFIEAAEALHLVADIDRVISSAAMDRCAHHVASGGPPLAHFINLSLQFLAREDEVEALLERARGYCIRCGLPEDAPKPLVIEITERQTGDLAVLKRHLAPLLQFGVRLALDDFGSGYSSFLYLAELPVAFIKIEGWMVARIVDDSRVRNLVETLVNTARTFGITTVAECVETAECAQVLCDLGVDWAQGYYFERPRILPELAKLP